MSPLSVVQSRQTGSAEHLEGVPLSFAQQRLWFLTQMEGASQAYHMPIGWRLSGKLDRHALKRALDRIVWRHEALRATFEDAGGEPVQRIKKPERGFQLEEHDLGRHEGATTELGRLMREECSRRFDLEQGPLIRGCLIKLSEQEHVLLITMHHIVGDGWSLGIFTAELSILYEAYRAGDADPLPPLETQYPDYALWQRKRLRGEVLQREKEYWQRTLQGAPVLLELPTDRPRPAQQTFTGDSVGLMLDADLTNRMKALARRHGITPYMLLVGSWAAVLARLSGQEEVVIGAVAANRTRPEMEGLIGFFVNTQALRLAVVGSVAGLLERVKECALEAQEHQELPFEQVVEIINPPRNRAYTPIFQVMLTWTGNDSGSLHLAGLRLAPVQNVYTASKFDLELDLRKAGEQRIEGELRYATALFDRTTMERHVGYIHHALASIVADQGQAVARIPLLSQAEHHQLVEEWNQTESKHPTNRCVHELFEEQAEKIPGAVALEFEGQELTYADLNHRANQLAWYLRRLGVWPEVRVGICMERGLEMMVGLLGVLKAGGGYVPLDPFHHIDRLAYIAQDAHLDILLTQSQFRNLLPGYRGKLIELDNLQITSEENGSPWISNVQPENLAYVIYTSGSTGTPKGVTVEHRQVCNQLFWAGAALDLGPAGRVLHKTSLSVDASIVETFVPLVRGARIIFARSGGEQDVEYLGRLVFEKAITYLDVFPALLEQMLDDPMSTSWTSLRVTCCGGDVLKPELVRAFYRTAPGVLWNAYGPTEATVQSTFFVCGEDGESVSIGRPIANTQIYVLDGFLEPVPIGVAGELYVGGAGVARGYLERPDLTAERFLANPFSPIAGARMYKTGDAARYGRDGNIEFLGRNDHQVKIRGYRIEPEEIEARLAEHPNVREAVIVGREDQPGNKRLVAYYRSREKPSPGADELRRHLAARLPEYMVPAAYVSLDRLPLNGNGKLDRRALPSPDADAYPAREYEAPVGKLEAAVARIWADVLSLKRIGRHDNFFQLGGHSLLVVKVKNLLHQLGIETTIADLFSYPTIKSLVASLLETPVSTPRRGAQRIRDGAEIPLFLVHDAYGDELYFSALAQYLHPELPVYGLPCVPADELQLRTMHVMAERMVNMIQEVQAAGPYRLAGWSFGGVLAYEIAQTLLDHGHVVGFLGLIDAWNPNGSGIEDHHQTTPEAMLMDLCERRMMERQDGHSVATTAFHRLDANLGFDELFNRYRSLQALPENFEHLTLHEARAQCRNLELHSRVMAAYHPRPIGTPVHLFVASDRRPESPAATTALGWERCVPQYLLYVQAVPGSHLSLMRPPHIKTLGRALMDSLVQAEESSHSANALQAKTSD